MLPMKVIGKNFLPERQNILRNCLYSEALLKDKNIFGTITNIRGKTVN